MMIPDNPETVKFYLWIGGELTPIENRMNCVEFTETVCDIDGELNNQEQSNYLFVESGTIEISFKTPKKEYRKIKRFIQSICPRNCTNNWRKMHGLPMIRRRKNK